MPNKISRLLRHWKLAIKFDPKQYWTEEGRTYACEHPPENERGEEMILDTLEKINFQSFLEIGCGYGRYLKFITEHFPHVKITGVDISPTQIAEAKKYLMKYPEIQLDENDGQKLKYADKSFDVSFTYGCMIHVVKNMIDPFFKEISRVTCNKGVFIEASEKRRISLKRLVRPPVVWYSHDYESLFRRFQKPYEIIREWGDRDITERLYLVDFS